MLTVAVTMAGDRAPIPVCPPRPLAPPRMIKMFLLVVGVGWGVLFIFFARLDARRTLMPASISAVVGRAPEWPERPWQNETTDNEGHLKTAPRQPAAGCACSGADNATFVDPLGDGCADWAGYSPCDGHAGQLSQYSATDLAIVREQCPVTCGVCKPRGWFPVRPPRPAQRGGLGWVWQPQSCSAAHAVLSAKMSAKHDRALILVPDSGWGDAVHALASAMVMCAAFDRRCLVFMPDEPAVFFGLGLTCFS